MYNSVIRSLYCVLAIFLRFTAVSVYINIYIYYIRILSIYIMIRRAKDPQTAATLVAAVNQIHAITTCTRSIVPLV